MNMPIGGTITPNSMTLIIDGVTNVLTPESHPNYSAIREAWKTKNVDMIRTLLDLTVGLRGVMNGRVTVEHGVVQLDGDALHNAITDRIVEQHSEGFDASAICNFLANLNDNPSKQAVDELYLFMEATNLPITEDGHFLAYKMVRDNYTDHHTGKFDNSIGAIPEMKRNQVDDRRDHTCSAGLHFCSQNYLDKYASGGRVMLLKVNPRDVVSIPSDYENAKGRACRYEVVGEIDKKFATTEHSFGTSVISDAQIPGSVLRDFETVPTDGQYVSKGTFGVWLHHSYVDQIRNMIEDGELESAKVGGKTVIVWRDRYKDIFLFDGLPEEVTETSSVNNLVLRDAKVRPVDGQYIAKRVMTEWLNWSKEDLFDELDGGGWGEPVIETTKIGGKTVIIWRDSYEDEFNFDLPEETDPDQTGVHFQIGDPIPDHKLYSTDSMDDLNDGDHIAKSTFARLFPNCTNEVRELIEYNDVDSEVVNGKTVIVWRDWYEDTYGSGPISMSKRVPDQMAKPAHPAITEVDSADDLKDGDRIAKRVFIDLFGGWPHNFSMNEVIDMISNNEIESARIDGRLVIIWRDWYKEAFGF